LFQPFHEPNQSLFLYRDIIDGGDVTFVRQASSLDSDIVDLEGRIYPCDNIRGHEKDVSISKLYCIAIPKEVGSESVVGSRPRNKHG
jgi:hypothetical protein